MDLKMNSYISCSELKNLINTHSVPEIQAISVKKLPEKSGNAMASVAAAEYYIGFKEGRVPDCFSKDAEEISEGIKAFLSQESIILVKEGKAGLREVDIKDRIFVLSWDTEENCIHTIVDASSGYNIKPAALIELLLKFNKDSMQENSLMIYRADTYTRDENGALISMGDIGSDE